MHGDEWLILIGIFLFLSLIVAPVLAIAAWVRVKRVERQRQTPSSSATDPQLIARIYKLEQQSQALERRISELTAGAAAPPRTVPVEPLPITPAMAAPPSPAPPPAATQNLPREVLTAPSPTIPPLFSSSVSPPAADEDAPGLETMIAGRWLNRIGIASVILAVAYFLKYAFDNQWIGPTGQVGLGILFGAGLLVFAHWLLGRGYLYFSEGIDGLGSSVLFLTLWAACNHYSPPVFSREVAFIGMILVTAAMLAIAVGRDSQRIAVLAMLGGYLTPMLVSTGQDAQVVLFTYLLVLGGGLLIFAHARDWRYLEGPAFFFTQLYFWGWYERFYQPEKLLLTLWFALLFFLLFSALPVIRARRTARLRPEQALLVLLNAGWFMVALQVMLWDHHRWPLTFAVLVLAAYHLIVMRLLPPPQEDEAPLARMLFAGLALTFVTLVIPIRLDGKWITMAWAIEGAVLMWTGFRTWQGYLRGAAFLLFAFVGMRLLAWSPHVETLLLNERFATYVVSLLCFSSAIYFWLQNKNAVDVGETRFFQVLGIAINVLALVALTTELRSALFIPYSYAGDYALYVDARLKYGLSISLLWMLYAAALLYSGVRANAPSLRWQALVLFGVVVIKVFFFDLASLRGFYRVVSFFVLGLLLLAVSFFYQKQMKAGKVSGG